MSIRNMGLGFVFTARDFATGKMQRLERQFSQLDNKVTGGAARMNTAFQQLGKGLGVFTAGAVAVGGGLALANAAGKFEQGLAAVGAVTRATTSELGMLKEAAIEAGIKTQFSPTEAVEGLQSLATAGQTAAQATRTLTPVLDLAAGSLGQLGVAQAAEAVVGTLNAYGLSADKASGVTDKLLRITQISNFQTRDFEAGLAKAAAAGATYGQSLDDVAITMGLLRNRNLDASSSATAFREATRRLGSDQRAQQAIAGAGVAIFDKATGKMRSIVDITSDFAKATENMTDKERNRRVTVAYGARGLLAFNAIQRASIETTRNGEKVILKGAAAIEVMRDKMSQASGTAAGFREKLLDTFEGQKTLLRGTLQTWAISLGEPFAAVFKPIVGTVVSSLNSLLKVFQGIPSPIKKAFAAFTTVGGAILSIVGAVMAAKGAVALLSIGMKSVGVSLGGIFASVLPAIAIAGLIALSVKGLRIAFEKNFGGIADIFSRLKDSVSLFFGGLKQIIEHGGFTGAIREELAKAENQGLKRFFIGVHKLVYRLGQVWDGLKSGFVSAVEAAKPVFLDLFEAFSILGGQISSLFSDLVGGASSLPTEQFVSFGNSVGTILGAVASRIANLVGYFTRFTSGVISGFRSMKQVLSPAFDAIANSFGSLKDAFADLIGGMGMSTVEITSIGAIIGKVLGGIVTVVSYAISLVIRLIGLVVRAITAIKDVVFGIGKWLGKSIAKIVPDSWLPEGMLQLKAHVSSEESGANGSITQDKTQLTNLGQSVMPSVTETRSRSWDFARLEQTVFDMSQQEKPSNQEQQWNINLQVDGETIARASHKASQDSAGRAFSPLPVF